MADDGKVIYRIEADDSGIDRQIDQANEKIKKAAQKGEKEVERAAKNAGAELSTAAEESAQSMTEVGKGAQLLSRDIENIGDTPIIDIATAANDAEGTLEDMAKSAKNAGRGMVDTSSGLGNLKKMLIGGGVTAALSKFVSTLGQVYEESKELRTDLSILSTNAEENGVSVDKAKKAWEEFSIVTGETDSAVEAVSNLLQAGIGETDMQRAVEALGGAITRFPDTLKVESLADSLQETLATGEATGQYAELLERLGVDVDDFNKKMQRSKTDAEAVDLALGVLEENGLTDTYNAYKDNNKELLENNKATLEQKQALADLGKSIEPFVTAFAKGMTTVIGWLEKVVGWVKTAIKWFVDLLAKIGDFLFKKRQIDTEKLTDDVTNLAERLGYDGSSPYVRGFRSGIHYVPADELPARLHRGERVLTAEQNARFNALGGLEGLESSIIDATTLSASNYISSPNLSINISGSVDVDGYKLGEIIFENLNDVYGMLG